MSLVDVDREKLRPFPITQKHFVDDSRLESEGASGKAAEDQHDRLLTAELLQFDELFGECQL
jgi:hypothetical protein